MCVPWEQGAEAMGLPGTHVQLRCRRTGLRGQDA